ncbi:hypothetical protein ACT29H_09475 [Thermophagus sp. OGC60D27]|uniref:hypothetical protein n=1 Tax=Thermophagus sp. OGC60D27 TaxID=3458415 RepID=UPI0040382460
MNAKIQHNSDHIEVNGCKLTTEMIERMKSFQEDDYLSRVQQNISEVLLFLLLSDRGDMTPEPPSKERIDDIASRLSLFIREIEDLKLPRHLRNYADGD